LGWNDAVDVRRISELCPDLQDRRAADIQDERCVPTIISALAMTANR
jgi:hypothetical protein